MGESAGVGGSAHETTLHGGAGGVERRSTDGAPWIGLGLVLALRRRRQSVRVQGPRVLLTSYRDAKAGKSIVCC